jgi:hypothetical protein
MMPAPDPMASIDIFNQPVNMRIGGLAGNPLDSYGDYLSQQIDNTQVEPFIQEVQQMASQRFNLGSGGQTFNASQPLMEIAEPLLQPSIFQRIPQQYPQDLSRPANLSIFNPEINAFQPFNSPQIQDMTQRPGLRFQMQGLGQPMRDKDGILREPMGLRGGSDMFTTFADGGGVASLMKKTTIEMQEIPADRKMLVMNRIMKQGGVTQSRDPRLMAQLAQVLGRDG